MQVATAISIGAALAAAFCFAVGSLVQQSVARESGQDVLRLRLLLDLVRQPRWVAGVALNSLSFAIQGLALAFGPLTLVQPIAATDVLFAMPMIARKHRRGLTPRDMAGALTVTAGLVIFLTVSPPVGGLSAPPLLTWTPVFVAVAGLASLAAAISVHVRGRVRVVWLAAAAGVIYGLLDALAKSTVDIIARHGWGVVSYWEPYALIAAVSLGALFGQSAFGAGALSLSLPVIDTLEPVSAVVIGTTVFGERLATSPGQLAVQLAGGAMAVVGVALLSRSSIVEAETLEATPVRQSGGRPAGC